jgi:hypothetical protein
VSVWRSFLCGCVQPRALSLIRPPNQIFMWQLTVEADVAVCFATRVLGHALVRALVHLGHPVDGEPHVRLVRRRPHRVLRVVLGALVDHVAVLARPVVQRRRVRLRVALERHAGPDWSTHQLVRNPQHRWNYKWVTDAQTIRKILNLLNKYFTEKKCVFSIFLFAKAN